MFIIVVNLLFNIDHNPQTFFFLVASAIYRILQMLATLTTHEQRKGHSLIPIFASGEVLKELSDSFGLFWLIALPNNCQEFREVYSTVVVFVHNFDEFLDLVYIIREPKSNHRIYQFC